MNYFKDVKSLEDLKNQYRKLAKQYHPDVGGSNEAMQQINAEYDQLKKQLGDGSKEQSDEMELYREVINNIIHLSGLEIEICGRWIWISGDTRKHKEKLKENKFRWAPRKKMWYWAPPQDRKRRRRSETSMERIREMYGSKKVTSKVKAIQ